MQRQGSYRTSPGLPQGWEVKRTKEGKQYYVDHNTRATHWELPPAVRQQIAHAPNPQADLRVHLPSGAQPSPNQHQPQQQQQQHPPHLPQQQPPPQQYPAQHHHQQQHHQQQQHQQQHQHQQQQRGRNRSYSNEPRVQSSPQVPGGGLAMGLSGAPTGGPPPQRPLTAHPGSSHSALYGMGGASPYGGPPPHAAHNMDVSQMLRMPASSSGSAMSHGQTRSGRQVYVNNNVVTEQEAQKLEHAIGIILPHNMRMWYDPLGGFWGMYGRPAEGIVGSHKASVAPIPRDASGGHTGVILNGRELHIVDLLVLQYVAKCDLARGSYWMDPNGTFGKAVKKGEQPIVYGCLFD